MNGKKKAAAEGGLRCGNLDCGVTGRDKVNQVCAACRGPVLQPQVPREALVFARRRPWWRPFSLEIAMRRPTCEYERGCDVMNRGGGAVM